FKVPDDEKVWTRFHEWVDAVKKRDSVWRTRSEDRYYEQVSLILRSDADNEIYSRYLNNVPFISKAFLIRRLQCPWLRKLLALEESFLNWRNSMYMYSLGIVMKYSN